MIIQEKVTTSWNASNKKHLISKGYLFTKFRDSIEVSVSDLTDSSNIKVLVKCDYCGTEFKRKYGKVIRGRGVTIKDACKSCMVEKTKETNNVLYGCDNTFQYEAFKQKSRETCMDKYGVEYAFLDNEVKEKQRKTVLAKYGCDNVFQSEEIKRKIKDTLLKKYGEEYTTRIPHVKKSISERNRIPYEEVFDEVELSGCKLITSKEDYTSTMSEIEILCKCGELFTTKYAYFKHEGKKQCNTCGIRLRSGENSPRYNKDLTDEERIENRDYPEYVKWRSLVYERDEYTCRGCNDSTGGNLVAHHLNGYNWDKTGRFDIDNGVTLCEICHKEFHMMYGYGDNTILQFYEMFGSL